MLVRLIALLAAGTACTAVAGCGTLHQREDAATSAARQYATAVRATDPAAICDRLAPATVEELELTAGTPCPRAVPDLSLPRPGAVRTVAVHGRQARVELAGDTLFLAAFPGGWKVTAAHCAPQGDERPYRCRLKAA